MNDGRTRVMLVDDHAVVRMGFRLLLEGSPDLTVVAEAESGEPEGEVAARSGTFTRDDARWKRLLRRSVFSEGD